MQNSNSAAHDKACQAIERAKGLVQEQEERFDAYFQSSGDIPQMYDLMEFYPIKDEYMFYKRELLDAMEEVSTTESLEAQLETTLEMLCLDRIDQNRVRFRVPLLMLQLGKDAECYAVIKWCSQPHIFDEYGRSDPFEEIEPLYEGDVELFPLANLAILKAKILLDLSTLDNCVLAVGA
ncbi:hypothetical protein N7509_012033 [Penicillium cosmopolitanum]|uniref:Uncharacterized protein n=1 Tax=Penicillium cosmopolitanum TaxID=1131564 RepID=A0A9W9SJM3_9EURO|nr:uncharacterized protein N7509_012033 [Penicillium cosmopolitanum]KAJ5378914.1 hypothetical protein N7509_012033 [Penicillium cosmopolitanum]